ncbi:GIY-YIG nuclease family protein [Algibacter sp. R77976]|uniref:GIY-YIG nuclease family protein n=1 Tax=Algibacter sp. R77976 TaxID=3093873 RepID=UPI0037CC1FCC
MIYYVYVIKSEKDNRLYKGLTQDLEKRINQHNMGENKSTKGFRPWVLIYSKVFTSRLDARDYEKYLKSGTGRDFLKTFI